MRDLARQRLLLPALILAGMSLVLPVSGVAAGDEFPPEGEIAPGTSREKISYAKTRMAITPWLDNYNLLQSIDSNCVPDGKLAN
jgi:hypothetical protein